MQLNRATKWLKLKTKNPKFLSLVFITLHGAKCHKYWNPFSYFGLWHLTSLVLKCMYLYSVILLACEDQKWDQNLFFKNKNKIRTCTLWVFPNNSNTTWCVVEIEKLR